MPSHDKIISNGIVPPCVHALHNFIIFARSAGQERREERLRNRDSTSPASIWPRTTGHVRGEIIMSAERVIKSSLLRPRCPFTRRAMRACIFSVTTVASLRRRERAL